jgi:hypothetical protein
VLGITQWPTGTYASPTNVNGRAALYSFGFLLRRAAADLLDVDERELKVGLRVVGQAGQICGQIFISDSLENGAGYSSRLGHPLLMQNVLEYVTGVNNPTFNAPLVAHNCQTSCPDCIRDFSNLAFHNILDWRLGLDLARLALDAAAPVDFTIAYWPPLLNAAATSYFAAQPQWQPVVFAGLPGATLGTRAQIITHPLWNTDQSLPANWPVQVTNASNAATTAGITQIVFKSLFDVLRRPYL